MSVSRDQGYPYISGFIKRSFSIISAHFIELFAFYEWGKKLGEGGGVMLPYGVPRKSAQQCSSLKMPDLEWTSIMSESFVELNQMLQK